MQNPIKPAIMNQIATAGYRRMSPAVVMAAYTRLTAHKVVPRLAVIKVVTAAMYKNV
jgi:hypothetical protein